MTQSTRHQTRLPRATDELVVTVSPDGLRRLEMTARGAAELEREVARLGHDAAIRIFMEQVFAEHEAIVQHRLSKRCG